MTVNCIKNLKEYKKDNKIFENNNNNGNICFDIETTGFNYDDKVTVIEFIKGKECIALLNSDYSCKNLKVESYIKEKTDMDKFLIVFYDNEEKLLDKGLRELIKSLNIQEERLLAYNGKTWSGGFDIPFLKTRLARQNIKNVFEKNNYNVYYADLLPEIQKNFNTTNKKSKFLTEKEKEEIKNPEESKSYNDLDTAHKIICGCNIKDNFEDSKQAVKQYKNNNIEKVLYHCHNDVKRTQCLLNKTLTFTGNKEPSNFKDTYYL